MSIVRDDCDERQIRIDRMIGEFRKAQSRRLAQAITVKDPDHMVELQGDASGRVAVARSSAHLGAFDVDEPRQAHQANELRYTLGPRSFSCSAHSNNVRPWQLRGRSVATSLRTPNCGRFLALTI